MKLMSNVDPDISNLVNSDYDYKVDGGNQRNKNKGNQGNQGNQRNQGSQSNKCKGTSVTIPGEIRTILSQKGENGKNHWEEYNKGDCSNLPGKVFNKLTEGNKTIWNDAVKKSKEGQGQRSDQNRSRDSQGRYASNSTDIFKYNDKSKVPGNSDRMSTGYIMKWKFSKQGVIDKEYMKGTATAIVIILIGIIMVDAFDHGNYEKVKNPVTRWLGLIIVTAGWGYLIFMMTVKRPTYTKIYLILSGFSIWISYIISKYYEGEDKTPNPTLTVMYSLGWLGFAYMSTRHLYSYEKWLWIPIVVSMIISTFLLLPIQRKFCVVDGPSLPLQVLGAWVPLIYANSMR
jgi:hypothetical protein